MMVLIVQIVRAEQVIELLISLEVGHVQPYQESISSELPLQIRSFRELTIISLREVIPCALFTAGHVVDYSTHEGHALAFGQIFSS